MKVTDDEELIVTSVKGMVIRMPVKGISIIGRATMGVTLMKLKERDKVTAVARLVRSVDMERVVEAGRTLTSYPSPNGDLVDDDDADGEEEPEEGQDGPEEDK
jgi:DNA gyrase subunit A